MNHNVWKVLVESDAAPEAYQPSSDLYTSDLSALCGVLLSSPGSRYNSEVNGTRASGWGKGQNEDFQQTAPFLALRSAGSLETALAEGIATALRDPQIHRDMDGAADPRQVAFWMADLANIALLDFTFSQQDRVGNIDYVPYWIWVEGGELRQRKANTHGDETEALPEGAVRIKRTHLNDNDAGARLEYANFAKSTGMLQGLRHFPAVTYTKLLALNADLQAQGPLHVYLRDSFGIGDGQLQQIVKNTALAAGILADSCQRGELAFDIDPEKFFLTGVVALANLGCDG